MLSTLAIECLLFYNRTGNRFDWPLDGLGDEEARSELLRVELLAAPVPNALQPPRPAGSPNYWITEKGRAYVQALTRVPCPEQVWQMPKGWGAP